MTDEHISSGIHDRDEMTIGYVIEKYSRLLWKITSSVLKNAGGKQDIEECVADTFILLWEHPEKYDPGRGTLKSWLSMVARCKAIDRYRELTRHDVVPLDSAMMAGRIGVQDALLQEETRRELIAAVNALAEQERDILLRRYYYEQKPRDIARALDMTVRQVDDMLYRTKRKLRRAISL